MIKRFARIYPLHFVMLVAFLALAILGSNSTNGAWAHVSLLHSWGVTDGPVLNVPSWTISAEMFAYILFGAIVCRAPPTWVITAAFVIAAIGAHAISVSLGKAAFLHLTWEYGSLRILPLFILGMLLRRLTPHVPLTIAPIVGLVGLGLFLWIARFEGAGYEILIPFVLLIVAGAKLSDRPKLVTNTKPLVYLGEISYSTYMIHMLIIAIWFDYLPKFGIGPFHWLFVCVLVPARRWINRYSR
jgi:peptidoglycan/LPS O-acetylase OafA/YrhL